MILNTQVLTEGRVVEGLGQLKLVVDGTPEDQETVESALAILRALISAADLLKEPQLSPDEIKRVGLSTLSIGSV